MARDIPVGNGQLLINFDAHYQIRDIFFPHVGQENHAGGGPCRFGIHGEIIKRPTQDRRARRLFWSHEDWQIEQAYRPNTLTTAVQMHHDQLQLLVRCSDVVDFHRAIMVRRIAITNLARQKRELNIYHHNDFHIFGTKVGDTVYLDPKLGMLVHYRGSRYLMAGFWKDDRIALDAYATGVSGFQGAEGTWRDAEDAALGGNPIAQGAVDSTIGIDMQLEPAGKAGAEQVVYMIIGAGKSRQDLVELRKFIDRQPPENVFQRTEAYWRLWLGAHQEDLAELPRKVTRLSHQSLLILRTQIDNNGAIIAANDSDMMQYSRDTYSYLWPRDGALVAHALDLAGYPALSRRFYYLCTKLITEQGFFHHKYNPDGSPASSWHPWVVDGRPQLPIQEDETALVLWALWRHYCLYRDIEFVRPLWLRLIRNAADFMSRFVDPITHLPLPSYDLWEERWGIHGFTTASVHGGLVAARNFAVCFGDIARAKRYQAAAQRMKIGFERYLWSDRHQRYLRRIIPRDTDRIAELMEQAIADTHTTLDLTEDAHRHTSNKGAQVAYELDTTIDASQYGLFRFGLFPPDDRRLTQTMDAVVNHLTIDTPVGGIARYQADHYHRYGPPSPKIPGNPWFICTAWVAQWHILAAKKAADLKPALPILDWIADHALHSGVLPEQLHPESGGPLSVSPLTWSHATLIETVIMYSIRARQLRGEKATCSAYRAHRPWRTGEYSQADLTEQWAEGDYSHLIDWLDDHAVLPESWG